MIYSKLVQPRCTELSLFVLVHALNQAMIHKVVFPCRLEIKIVLGRCTGLSFFMPLHVRIYSKIVQIRHTELSFCVLLHIWIYSTVKDFKLDIQSCLTLQGWIQGGAPGARPS